MANYKLNIDANGVLASMLRTLHPVVERTSMGLLAAEAVSPQILELPVFFRYQIPENDKRDFESVRVDFKTWLLTAAFRDMVEAIHAMLEEARLACAVVFHSKNGVLTGGEFNDLVVGKAKAFHKKGLPDKIDYLNKTYQLSLESSDDAVQQILSLNQARNCLVHRAGVVTMEDVNDGAALRVTWNDIVIIAGTTGNERIVHEEGTVVKAGETVSIRLQPSSKSFAMGERIMFDANEFSKLCLGFLSFGRHITQMVDTYVKCKGLPVSIACEQVVGS